METLAQRLKKTLILKGMTARELAEEVGISESSISRTLHEKGKPTRANLKVICKVLGIDKEWLTTGNGQKEANEVENSPLLVETQVYIQHKETLLDDLNKLISQLENEEKTSLNLEELNKLYTLQNKIKTELISIKK